MAFEVESRESLFTSWLEACKSKLPTVARSRLSDLWVVGRIVTAVAWGCLARLIAFDRDSLPDKAKGASLRRWGSVHAFPSKSVSASQGTLALLVTGTSVGASVPVDSTLTHSDGTVIKITSVGAVLGGDLTVLVDVVSVTKGIVANKVAGETFNFDSTPTNVTTEATLAIDLSNGTDVETEEDYRVRLLAHIGDPPSGGAIHDWLEWALSVAGVRSAYIYRHRRGLGTMDVVVLGTGEGSGRRITDTTDVSDYIETVRPANMKDFLVLDTDPTEQDCTVEIEVDETKYKWDWIDDGTGTLITANSSGASTITLSGTPAGVATLAGKRITVRGEEALVTAYNTGTFVATLAFANDENDVPVTWFTFTITNSTDRIRASGDLVVPARKAIIELFGRLGPARADENGTSYGATEWSDRLLTDDILSAVKAIVGEGHKVVVTTPSADVEPIDPITVGEDIPFLVPGVVKVVRHA